MPRCLARLILFSHFTNLSFDGRYNKPSICLSVNMSNHLLLRELVTFFTHINIKGDTGYSQRVIIKVKDQSLAKNFDGLSSQWPLAMDISLRSNSLINYAQHSPTADHIHSNIWTRAFYFKNNRSMKSFSCILTNFHLGDFRFCIKMLPLNIHLHEIQIVASWFITSPPQEKKHQGKFPFAPSV